jgi:hypothetical protein
MLAPPDSVSGNNAAAGRNYHFVASVLGNLKHGPRNLHAGRLAILRVTCNGHHDSVLSMPIDALLSAQVQSMMRHFRALLRMWHNRHRPE